MNDLERFLRDHNADADTWIDEEGLHVHDWETDRCLLFDANESDYRFICIYIHALRTLSVFGACLTEISPFDLTLTKIENDQVAVALELGYMSDNDSKYHNFKKEAIVPRKELFIDINILMEDLFDEAERKNIMKVIFIKDTRENPAHKQIKAITSSYDYVDAYVFDDEIKYFGKLPQAPLGAYIYDQRLEGILEHFELETLSPKKLRRLSWMDYRLIQFLQTGEYYVPQKFTDELKKVTVEHFFVRYQKDAPQWFIDFLKEHNIKFEIKS